METVEVMMRVDSSSWFSGVCPHFQTESLAFQNPSVLGKPARMVTSRNFPTSVLLKLHLNDVGELSHLHF